MRIYLLIAAIILILGPLLGQEYVVVSPAGLTPLSPSAVATANAALSSASGSSEFDVRMAFMTSAGGVGDRYQEYLTFKEPTDRYMEFLATPYEDDLENGPDDLEQEHQRLLAKGVDTLGGGGSKSVLIVYTTVLSITDQGTSYSSKKNILYGNDLTGCDLRRFKQIEDFVNPPADYCVASAPAANDGYLSWISGHFADAMSDDYVITGTILYKGDTYCEDAVVYIDDQQSSVVTISSTNDHYVEVLVNDNMDGVSVSWSDDNAVTYMFEEPNSLRTKLLINPQDYGQFTSIFAVVGGKATSKLNVLPVNFKVEINRGIVESNNPEPFKLTYFNNDIPFTVRGDIEIRLSGTFTGAPDVLVPAQEFNYDWVPGENACGEMDLVSALEGVASLTGISNSKPIQVRCPFTLEGLMAKTVYGPDIGKPSPVIRIADVGETLYTVYNAKKAASKKRDIGYQIKWEGDVRPDPDDYWTGLDVNASNDEPNWVYAGDKLPTATNMTVRDSADVKYDDHNPDDNLNPGGGLLGNIANYVWAGPNELKTYTTSITAFEQNADKDFVFVPRNENKFKAPVPNIDSILKKVLNKADKIKKKFKVWGAPVELFYGVSYDLTLWNAEDKDGPQYHNYWKHKAAGSIGLKTRGFQEEVGEGEAAQYSIIIPGLGFDLSPVAEGGVFFRGKVSLAPSYSKENRKYPSQSFLDGETVSHTLDLTLTPSVHFGVKAEVLPDWESIQAIVEGYASIVSPVNLAGTYKVADDGNFKWHFNGKWDVGPVKLNANISMKAKKVFGMFDYELFSWTPSIDILDAFTVFEFVDQTFE